jgi:hypothetical protein
VAPNHNLTPLQRTPELASNHQIRRSFGTAAFTGNNHQTCFYQHSSYYVFVMKICLFDFSLFLFAFTIPMIGG